MNSFSAPKDETGSKQHTSRCVKCQDTGMYFEEDGDVVCDCKAAIVKESKPSYEYVPNFHKYYGTEENVCSPYDVLNEYYEQTSVPKIKKSKTEIFYKLKIYNNEETFVLNSQNKNDIINYLFCYEE